MISDVHGFTTACCPPASFMSNQPTFGLLGAFSRPFWSIKDFNRVPRIFGKGGDGQTRRRPCKLISIADTELEHGRSKSEMGQQGGSEVGKLPE